MEKIDTPQATAKLFVVEDHPAMQRAYRDLFNRQPDLTVCGVVESAELALEQIPEAQPDIAIIDVSLKRMDGIELVRQLKSRIPTLRTLIISGHDRAAFADTAHEAGANGYVMKMHTHHILTAIRQILQTGTYRSEA